MPPPAGFEMENTPAAPLVPPGTADRLRAHFDTHATRPLSVRLERLGALLDAVGAHERDIWDALHADLRKAPHEAFSTETGFVQSEIRHAMRRLPRWMRPQKRRSPLIAWPARSCVVPEPRGVALIIGPWNYPFQLLLSPAVAALAAGNCVCLKPSELAPNVSAVVRRMIQSVFPPEYISVVEGGRETAEALLRERFDHVFFTGSTGVGRAVMRAAAETLTPVTLELGGKSPVVVCRDANLETAARRILWGKCMNAGQTCVAPDYVLVEEAVREPLLRALAAALEPFAGGRGRNNPHYGRIINRGHFDRVAAYLSQGRIVCGGELDRDDLFIAPTILADVDFQSPVMEEEIFGPVLPVAGFTGLDWVFEFLRRRPKPLALYLFTEDRAVQRRVIAETSSGGVCINDTVSHMINKELPFGGVGDSGMGAYRGRTGFDTFSHHKSVMRRSLRIDPKMRYSPGALPLERLKKIYRFLLGG